ncbi:LysM peptidoglycan-binding domain-containing protein [Aerococcus kribbianus]|uniref:LysM peptidoglycan-binding domain-containing protein n=1 Tax=Aerococcus kribbianus TaxID=2999064 RepID=A0A9X3FPF7_9LACT|nr:MULTISPECIES: LysM peptidoglycan-binding domain-containing protein [unclassified Aerococcus]MCZ0718114.1 LysM peptidoglycan-binding domain-containing protein [Aerococcus sp. YH-aer221]MCZ0726317.1 LysM peptidoglycan-binding domain-containing protein [Aerococcus sp. YH-aer222]
MKEDYQKIKNKISKWWQPVGGKIQSGWQQLSTPLKFLTAVLGVILLFLLTLPFGINGEEGNPLGLSAKEQSSQGKSSYSAVAISGEEKVTSEKGPFKAQVSSLAPEQVSDTTDGIKWPSVGDLESQYAEREGANSQNRSSTSSSQASESDSADQESHSASEESSQAPDLENQEESQSQGTETYTVQSGDNLYRIAINHGMTLEEIMALNGMSEPYISPGMTIRVE